MTRAVYLIGDKLPSEDAVVRLRMADRDRGPPIVIADGRYYEVPAATAPAPSKAERPYEPVVDLAYDARAKAAAEAKRARKAACRAARASQDASA